MKPGRQYGDFVLVSQLGEGGMGTVWDATHLPTGEAAAIKLIRNESASDSAFAAFRAEAEAVARCRHPNIVRILDYGVTEGQRWFAMERVDGGDLANSPPGSWAELRPILEGVLAGLAHTHARGIIHRDLKPGNVLLADVPKLTDFGLAHRSGGENRTEAQVFASAGTPFYMSPEQLHGRWRDFGPWSDLYALGCLAFELVTGAPPFMGRNIVDTAQRHLTGDVPPMAPRYAVPSRLEAWVLTLLVKEPHHRLGTAAEALALLPEASAVCSLGPPGGVTTGPVLEHATTMLQQAVQPAWDSSSSMDAVSAAVVLPAAVPLASSEAWGLERRSLQLFGLRPIAMLGRAAEASVLWDVLRDSDAQSESRVVLLEGPDGCGKSELAWWIAHTGHERAAARVFRAAHHDPPAPRDGLDGMLRVGFCLEGMEQTRAHERLSSILTTLGVGHLSSLAGELAGINPGARLTDPMRYGLTRRLLSLPSRGHPSILLIENLHMGADACKFVLDAAQEPSRIEAPLLVVCTVDAQADSEPLRRLRAHSDVRTIHVGPLPIEATAELVRSELRLDPALAQQVARASGGFVDYALQMVGDLVQAGELVEEDGRLTAAGAGSLPLPESARELWATFLARFVRDENELLRLGAAAVLGPHVDRQEWDQTLQLLRSGHPGDLVERLVRAGLAEGHVRYWSLRYKPFRAVIVEELRRRGDLVVVHAAVASVLQRGARTAGRLERLAHHLLEARDAPGALEVCCAAAAASLDTAGARNQHLPRLLAIAARARELGAQVSVEDAKLLRLAEAAFLRNQGDSQGALDLTDGWDGSDRLAARAALVRAAALQQLGRLEEAMSLLQAGLAQPFDEEMLAAYLRSIATVCIRQRDFDGAERYTRKALTLLDRVEDAIPIGWCHYRLADLSRQRGDGRAAESHLLNARDCFRRAGFEVGVGETKNMEGALLQAAGDFEGAMRVFGQAYRQLREAGSPWAVTARLNGAVAAVLSGHVVDLTREVEDLRDQLHRKQFGLVNLVGLLVECAVATELEDRARFDRCAAEAEKLLLALEDRDAEMVELAEWIRRRWNEHGDERRSRRIQKALAPS